MIRSSVNHDCFISVSPQVMDSTHFGGSSGAQVNCRNEFDDGHCTTTAT